MGILTWCHSVKKRNPQKIRRRCLGVGYMEAVGVDIQWGCCGNCVDSTWGDKGEFGRVVTVVAKVGTCKV